MKKLPWATFGRRETAEDLFQKADAQRSRVALMGYLPRFSVQGPESLRPSLEWQSYPHWNLNGGGGDWLVFADGILNPVALYELALSLQGENRPELLYANETSPDEARSKPQPSRIDLLHFNYVGKPWAVSVRAFEELGGLGTGPHAEHEFLLRFLGSGRVCRALPLFLAHRSEPWFPSADEALAQMVREQVGFPAKVTVESGRIKIRPRVSQPKKHLISAIVCYRDQADWTVECVRQLSRRVGEVPVEVILVDNGSTPAHAETVRRETASLPLVVKHLSYEAPFNFARQHNWAIETSAQGDLLLLLNNDVFLEGDWNLDEWAGWALRKDVGTVGIQLRYPDGRVQHSGIKARFGGEARLARIGHENHEDLFTEQTRETFANTFAGCLLRRSVFQKVGGLRELDLPNGFGDVAFNFECLKRGLSNLYLGHLRGLHLESATRGNSYEYWEECILESEYPELLQRMLRQDLGVNRTPGSDWSLPVFLRVALHGALQENARPVLKAVQWAKTFGSPRMWRRYLSSMTSVGPSPTRRP